MNEKPVADGRPTQAWPIRMRIMKTTEKKVNKDVEALTDDIRRVRDDLAGLLRSARRRAKNVAAESKARKAARTVESSAPEATVYVEEPGQPEKRVVVRRPPTWARILAAVFALGTIITVIKMQRNKVVVTHLPRRRWRPGFRRVAVQTATGEPAAEETPLSGGETVIREESTVEG